MVKKQGFFIKGLPIPSVYKLYIIIFLFAILILNAVLPRFFEAFNYTFNGGVSVILISLIFIFSIGNRLTEGLVIGLATVAIISNLWDFFVRDFSPLRNKILLGSIIILTLSLIFGRLSVVNLVHIIRKQIGVEKK